MKTVSIEVLRSGRYFSFANDKNGTKWLCTFKSSVVGGEFDGMYKIEFENKKLKQTCKRYISRATRIFLY